MFAAQSFGGLSVPTGDRLDVDLEVAVAVDGDIGVKPAPDQIPCASSTCALEKFGTWHATCTYAGLVREDVAPALLVIVSETG
jgi:hypothetical protein